tara:strand:+ start:150 stop:254 length:105 start_codon:yes stop_codon:yes gene_type:complete
MAAHAMIASLGKTRRISSVEAMIMQSLSKMFAPG